MKPKEKALLIAELAKAKLAEDIVILDIRKLSNIADFFVIASASSTKRCQTIAENIESGLSERHECVSKIEGYRESVWMLIDAYDVVVHIFYGDSRKFYDLEGLWDNAHRINPQAIPGIKTGCLTPRSIKLCRKKKKSRSKKTSTKK